MTVITDEHGQYAWDKRVGKWLRGKEIDQSAGYTFKKFCRKRKHEGV